MRGSAAPFGLLALALTAACVSAIERKPPRLGVDLPGTWTAPEAEATAGAVADEWWTSFGDPRLDELVARALERNQDLRITAARLARAAAEARIAGAERKPSAGASLDGSRRRQNFIGFPIPGAPPDAVLSTTSTSLGLSLSAAWEVDLWGRVRAGARAAVADRIAAGFDLRAARLAIQAQTAKAWFSVVEAGRLVELADQTTETFRLSAEQVRSRYLSGTRPSLDLRLALANLARTEALAAARREQLDRATRRLEILTGDYPAGAVRARPELPAIPPPAAPGLPADLLSRRPDLMAAEARALAADERLIAARRSLYPRLSLTAGGGTASDELRDLLDGDLRVWNLVANLTRPLFQGGRLRGAVDGARAGADEALERHAAATLRALAEVESALAAEQHLARREEHLRGAMEQAVAARRLAEERYRTGLEPYVTVLEAQRQALATESDWIAVRRLRLDNRVDLHVALGGGFEATGNRLQAERTDGAGEAS